jgi:hypothetical protein
MQAKQYLKNSDLVLGSKGYVDVLAHELNLTLLDAGAVVLNNALIVAIIAERNNVHTELGDGITDVAPVTVAVAADAGGRARYIVRELIQCMEGNVPYGVSLIRDESITPATAAPTDTPILLGDYVDGTTTLIADVAARTVFMDLRAASIAAAYALWDGVDGLTG